MIRELFDTFRSHERQLYVVGGAVRDTIRGVPYDELPDIDFVTDATREEIMRYLDRFHFFSTTTKGFGTLGIIYNGKKVEVKPYQTQSYRGIPLTIVPELEALAHDLSHRDFTINAIAMDANGNYIDPFGGRYDIERRLIRAVNGTPEEMLEEDSVRALRCARFASTLGFQVDSILLNAIRKLSYLLSDSSPERAKEEMDKLLVGDYVTEALQFLADSAIGTYVLPEIVSMAGLSQPDQYHDKDVWEHTKATVEGINPVGNRPYHILRWAALLHDVGKSETRSVSEGRVHFYGHESVGSEIFDRIAQRLRFSNEERRVIRLLITNHLRPAQYTSSWSDSSVRRLVQTGGDYLEELMEISRADIASHRPEVAEEGLRSLEELRGRIRRLEERDALKVKLPKDIGYAIMQNMALKPGPRISELKSRINEAIIEGELPANPSIEVCINFLKRLKL